MNRFEWTGPDPFWIIGFGFLAQIAWQVWSTKSIQINRDGMGTHRRCRSWSRTRWIEFDRIQHAQRYHPKVTQEGQKTYGVEIVYRGGSFVLPVDGEPELNWLAAEINDFLENLVGASK